MHLSLIAALTCTLIATACSPTPGSVAVDGLPFADAELAVHPLDSDDVLCTSAKGSVATFWIEVALDAIRGDRPEPTIHARNLFHLSAAMWDGWAALDPNVAGLYHPQAPAPEVTSKTNARARATAISFAAHHILSTRYADASTDTVAAIDAALTSTCGVAPEFAPSTNSPAAVGRDIASEILRITQDDGSLVDGERTPPPYLAANEQLYLDDTGTTMADPNRWQPLYLGEAMTRNGLEEPAGPQQFFAAHWGSVDGFALPTPGVAGLPIDPGPPPLLGTTDHRSDGAFKAGIAETLRFGVALALEHEVVDLSPTSRGNRPLGQYQADGYPANPATGEPYMTNRTDRADYGRVIAEFWADGPDSETPPGHWNVLAIKVVDELGADLRIGGTGQTVGRLEWDVKMFVALNGALHDAAIAAWGAKGHYDYVRPISMVRYMGTMGQSSDPQLPNFHPHGLLLEDGIVEVITEESATAGARHQHLARSVDKIAVQSWLGQPLDPTTEVAGIGWVLAGDWIPYQRPTFVTPAFAAYVSGHSAFSRAGAEVLAALTGSPFFPGGLYEHRVETGELTHEQGPSHTVTLQWATYADAADEAGISRLYGGIHVPADDLAGRTLGAEVGRAAWRRAEQLFARS